ncbi:hypothetical protein [Leptothoe kymatousa]|uniref:Outer membrane protein beta-barrel domain-containing protein n=1 Tax=Leptothoe kymatousa TAU-MAC 1615 TaxID=2364775 RepID=A0ABS5Y0Z7_9CYAN|nr:hypothetical protein [Leptothoe kymatousa]MBT9311281.1 hypothetical protein [Leptothoe kymatousa TAU-MAC 1615]
MGLFALVKPLLGAAVGVLGLSSAALALPLVESGIENYAGAGIRAGFNDSTALVLDSKFQVFPLEMSSVSVRPAVYIGDDLEGRLPLSYDFLFDDGFLLFGGAGVAYNFDEGDLDPMFTAGVDLGITERLVLNVEGNLIIKSNDTDAEVAASINWRF